MSNINIYHPIIRQYHKGWQPDVPDQRDHEYAKVAKPPAALPPAVDLRPKDSPVEDQGQLGSCTANALAGALQFLEKKDNVPSFTDASRLFIYYNERAVEGTVASDSGAQIRDGIKTLAKQGVCPETEWPYDITKFADQPPSTCYSDAKKHLILSYARLTTLQDMKGCLANGNPFVFGFTVYESFESAQVAQTGIAPMPAAGEKVLGGHAVMCVGYSDADKRFIVRNSWGPGWGMKGYFTLPYDYVTNGKLADDFWTISRAQDL